MTVLVLKNDREIALRAPIRLISDEVTIQASSGSFLNQANNQGVTPLSITLKGYAQTFTNAATVVWSYSVSNNPSTWTVLPIEIPIITTVLTGNGLKATATFAAKATAPYAVGSTILITNAVPAAYNGNFVVTECTITSVSWAATTTGAQTTPGNIISTSIPYDNRNTKYNDTTKIVTFGIVTPKDWFVTTIGTSVSMTFKCTIKENLKADSSGTTNIWYNKHGNNGIVIDLLSESDVVPASSTGVVSGTIPDNQIRVYSGGVLVPNSSIVYGLSGGTVNETAKTSSKLVNNLSVSVSTTTGLIKFTGVSAWDSIFEVITFTATYFGTTYSANYTISKSKAGSDSVFIDLISEADVVSADYTGLVTTLPSGNAVRLYKGGVILGTGVTYAVGKLTEVHTYATASTPSSSTLNELKCAVNSSGNITLSQPSNWIATQQEQFTLYAKYLDIEYSSIYSIAKSLQGDTGEEGKKSVTISVYTWKTGAQPARPVDNVSAQYPGTDMYLWSNGTFPVPGIGDVGGNYIWSASAPTDSTSGATLYVANLRLLAPATEPATVLDWSKSVIGSIGYRVDGTIGPQGPGACKMYCAIPTGNSFSGTTEEITDSLSPYTKQMPGLGTYWGLTNIVWKETPPDILVNESLFTSDGIFDVNTNKTTWQLPYLANLKVGSLSALSAHLGTVQISTSGALYSGKHSYEDTSKGFYLGADNQGRAKLNIGDSTNYLKWSGDTIQTSGLRVYANDGSLILSSGGPNTSNSSGNIIPNSMPALGTDSGYYVGSNISPPNYLVPTIIYNDSTYSPTNKGSVLCKLPGTFSTGTMWIVTNLVPVKPSTTYEVSAFISTYRCRASVIVQFFSNSSFADISSSSGSGITDYSNTAKSGNISLWNRDFSIVTSSAIAKFARIVIYADMQYRNPTVEREPMLNSVDPIVVVSSMYLAPAYANQTTPSPWSDKVVGEINLSNVDTYIKNAVIDFAKISNTLQSTSYSPGSGSTPGTGWRLDKNGNLEANNATFRGTVYATSGEFTGKVTATSGKFTGEIQATSGKFTGEIQATSGKFKGTIQADDGYFKGSLQGAKDVTADSLKVGTAAVSTPGSGHGAHIQSDGSFLLGGENSYIHYSQPNTYITIHGNVISTGNINSNAVSLSDGALGNVGNAIVFITTNEPCKIFAHGFFTQGYANGKEWKMYIGNNQTGYIYADAMQKPIINTTGAIMCSYDFAGGPTVTFAIRIYNDTPVNDERCGITAIALKR